MELRSTMHVTNLESTKESSLDSLCVTKQLIRE